MSLFFNVNRGNRSILNNNAFFNFIVNRTVSRKHKIISTIWILIGFPSSTVSVKAKQSKLFAVFSILQFFSKFYIAEIHIFFAVTERSARIIEEEPYKIELNFASAYLTADLTHQYT